MPRFKDLSGLRFGRLVAIEVAGRIGSTRNTQEIMWRCICDCGVACSVRGGSLRGKGTQSCGCLGRERRTKWEKPLCHPDRKHAALGLCSECYQTQYKKRTTVERHMKKYGTTDPEGARRALLIAACLICGRTSDLHIDHDHGTGIVRGRLCGNCNRGIGLFRDNPALLRIAADYVAAQLVFPESTAEDWE